MEQRYCMSSENPKKYDINYEGDRPVSITEDTSDDSGIYAVGVVVLGFVIYFFYNIFLGYLPLILSLLTGTFGSFVGVEVPTKKDPASKSFWALIFGGLLGSVTFLGANFVEKRVYPETARDSRENVLSIFMNDKIQQKKKVREVQEQQLKEDNLKEDVEKMLLNADELFE